MINEALRTENPPAVWCTYMSIIGLAATGRFGNLGFELPYKKKFGMHVQACPHMLIRTLRSREVLG